MLGMFKPLYENLSTKRFSQFGFARINSIHFNVIKSKCKYKQLGLVLIFKINTATSHKPQTHLH